MKYLILLINLFIAISLSAQENQSVIDYRDRITLKSGSSYIGKVLAMTDDVVKIRILGGYVLDIQSHRIKKHEQILVNQPKPYAFKEEGVYHRIDIGFMSSTRRSDTGPLGGLMLEYVIGRAINKNIRLGFGTGINAVMITENIYNWIPVYFDFSGYTKSKKVSPYYGLKAGTGHLISADRWRDADVDKIWFIHPQLGVRLTGGEGANSHLSIGFRWIQLTSKIERPEFKSLQTQRAFRWTFNYNISF